MRNFTRYVNGLFCHEDKQKTFNTEYTEKNKKHRDHREKTMFRVFKTQPASVNFSHVEHVGIVVLFFTI